MFEELREIGKCLAEQQDLQLGYGSTGTVSLTHPEYGLVLRLIHLSKTSELPDGIEVAFFSYLGKIPPQFRVDFILSGLEPDSYFEEQGPLLHHIEMEGPYGLVSEVVPDLLKQYLRYRDDQHQALISTTSLSIRT